MISSKTDHNKRGILFFTPWYPNHYDSMPGLFVRRHAQLAAQWAPVSVLCVQGVPAHEAPPRGEWTHSRIQAVVSDYEGVEEIVVYFRKMQGGMPLWPLLVNGVRYLKAFYRGWTRYRKQHGLPGLIHVNVLNRCGLLARAIKTRYGVPYVITEHWSRYLKQSPGKISRADILLTRMAVNGAAAMSAVSHNLKNSMEETGIRHPKFHILYNFIDTSLFTISGRKKNQQMLNFLHVSCFEQQSKNMQGILKVAIRLWEEGYSFHLTMVGNTPGDEQQLRNMMDISDKHVFFQGVLEKEQLTRAFHKADYQVLFSNYETFGIVVYEGLASGVPVIATKTADIPLHIDEKKGMLVDPGSVDGLYKCMKHCIEHRPVYHAAHLRSYAIQHFSREAVSRQLKALYQEALPEPLSRQGL